MFTKKELGILMKRIDEYSVTIINGSDKEDFTTGCYQEAKDYFEENKEDVSQFFRKDWVLVNGSYEEDFVEVYYTKS